MAAGKITEKAASRSKRAKQRDMDQTTNSASSREAQGDSDGVDNVTADTTSPNATSDGSSELSGQAAQAEPLRTKSEALKLRDKMLGRRTMKSIECINERERRLVTKQNTPQSMPLVVE
ncbi:hypothetical protein OG21DRAFT_1516581 [Imleria badia]|nr:hypothetical protein OG21DRAFT_1516581 [Imleria badia]